MPVFSNILKFNDIIKYDKIPQMAYKLRKNRSRGELNLINSFRAPTHTGKASAK